MEQAPKSSVLERARAFMREIESNDPAPVPLEMNEEGPYVQMELTLGVYDVKDPTNLKVDGTPGLLIPELLEKEEASPSPSIEEIEKK
ncbi:unnamed protein product [Blepharisma stoltei]|uniref:Uncharacterized protein n=1 Tax=Blepharisma stoltei TaxID=1481888 RepID=A0AAU9J0M4_9CILI|nr:unnamed protein product [Blepharisma stoltei]